jgi:hypothetical protein
VLNRGFFPPLRNALGKACITVLARTYKAFHEPSMESLWYHINEIEPLPGYSCGLTVRFSSFFYLLAFKYSPSVLMVSSHYPRTRPTNFCVMPLVCAQSIYPTRHGTLEPSLHNPPCGTCVFHSSYTLNEDCPYISHLHLFLSLTLVTAALSSIASSKFEISWNPLRCSRELVHHSRELFSRR